MSRLEQWQWDHLKQLIETSPLSFDQIALAIVKSETKEIKTKEKEQ